MVQHLVYKKMRSKYGNIRTTIDNVSFASKREAKRYQELKLLLRAKQISQLELQPRFELQPSFTDGDGVKHRKIEYVADFAYRERGQHIAEDVKGKQTDVYRLKKKLFLYKFGRLYTFRELE